MPGRVNDIAGFLAGDWQISRRLREARPGGIRGVAQGSATFERDGHLLRYRESVNVQFGGFSGPATRGYTFRLLDDTRAEVLFEDGRLFHLLDMSAGRWHCEHQCAPDLYCGQFRVLDVRSWVGRWKVTGPRKRLRITTLYRRPVAPATSPD